MKSARTLSTTIRSLALGSALLCGAAAGSDQGIKENALVQADLEALRASTLHYQRLENAENAGYQLGTPCLENPPIGGMGFHWINGDYVNEPTPDVLRPEALVYEPMPDGSLRLVAVEYIVPVPAWNGGDKSQPPRLFGHDFHELVGADLWVLHAWLYKNNPAGTFADWNPNVNCDNA